MNVQKLFDDLKEDQQNSTLGVIYSDGWSGGKGKETDPVSI